MASREVSTSTIGVGRDYNEELLSAMAQAGAGNYYYVDNPVQLTDVFQTELSGLMGTAGRHVELALQLVRRRLACRRCSRELERGPAGQILLPDLVCEMPISVLIRLEVTPREPGGRTLPVPAHLGGDRFPRRCHANRLEADFQPRFRLEGRTGIK